MKREAEKKKKSALQKLFQKKRYQKQYQAARQSKKVKDAAITSAQKFTEKAKECRQDGGGTEPGDFCHG